MADRTTKQLSSGILNPGLLTQKTAALKKCLIFCAHAQICQEPQDTPGLDTCLTIPRAYLLLEFLQELPTVETRRSLRSPTGTIGNDTANFKIKVLTGNFLQSAVCSENAGN